MIDICHNLVSTWWTDHPQEFPHEFLIDVLASIAPRNYFKKIEDYFVEIVDDE
jgi:hypothetical protein